MVMQVNGSGGDARSTLAIGFPASEITSVAPIVLSLMSHKYGNMGV